MNEAIKAIMNRDGITEKEAKQEFRGVQAEIMEMLAEGGSYEDIEDILIYDLGLEMDYFLDFI